MLLATQFMFAAGAIAFVAFGTFGLGGRTFGAGAAVALFAGATAVAELAVGLTMSALIHREHDSFAVDADREDPGRTARLALLAAAPKGPLAHWSPAGLARPALA